MKPFLTSVQFAHARNSKWLRIIVGLIALFLLTLGSIGSIGPIYADDPKIGPGGEILDETDNVLPLTPEAQALKTKRLALLADYNSVKAGTMTMATYNTHMDDFLLSVGITDTARHHPDRLSDCADTTTSNCADPTESFGDVTASAQFASGAALQERRILWMVIQAPQANGYYCGPASAYSLLGYWGFDFSNYNEALSQYPLAATCASGSPGCLFVSGKYLMTDYYGSTPWTFRYCLGWDCRRHWPIQYGVNRWYNGSENSLYLPVGIPNDTITYSMFKNALTQDMDAGWPMIGNVDEYVNQTHLPGHPNRNISHIIAIRGYSNWGNNVHYVDSVYQGVGLEGYTLTQGNQRMTTSDLTPLIARKGYIW